LSEISEVNEPVMSELPVKPDVLSKKRSRKLKSPDDVDFARPDDFELRLIPVNNQKKLTVKPPEMPVRSSTRKSEAREAWGSSTFVIAKIED